MSEKDQKGGRDKLIADALEQCRQSREVIAEKFPHYLNEIRTLLQSASKEGLIRSQIAELRQEESADAKTFEIIRKYLLLSDASLSFKQAIKTMLERHKN